MEKEQLFELLENERFERQLGDLILCQYQDEIEERKKEVERETFKKELSDLLLDQYRGEIEERDKTLEQKDAYIEACKVTVAKAYDEISTLTSEIMYWKQQVVVNEDQISALTEKLGGHSEQIARQGGVIAKLKKGRREAMNRCRYFEAQIDKLKTTYDELACRVEALAT